MAYIVADVMHVCKIAGVPWEAESELHERFDKYRHRGEWFWLEGKLLDYVKEIKA